jgi:hypothetical protein
MVLAFGAEPSWKKPRVALPGTVEQVIAPPLSQPENVEIAVEGSDELHQKIRTDNTLAGRTER